MKIGNNKHKNMLMYLTHNSEFKFNWRLGNIWCMQYYVMDLGFVLVGDIDLESIYVSNDKSINDTPYSSFSWNH